MYNDAIFHQKKKKNHLFIVQSDKQFEIVLFTGSLINS